MLHFFVDGARSSVLHLGMIKTRKKSVMVSRLLQSMAVMSKLAVCEMNERAANRMFEGLRCSNIARLHCYQFAVATIAEDLGLATFYYTSDARGRMTDRPA